MSDVVKNFPLDVQINVAVEYFNKKNEKTEVDGAPVWSVKSGDVTVVPAADGLSAKIKSNGVASLYAVESKADADMDNDEVRDLIVNITGAVTALEADTAGVTVVEEPLEA